MANKGLFVLNADLSGVNSHMFRGLGERGWDIRVVDVGLPALQRGGFALRSFHWNRDEWKRQYHSLLGSFAKSPRGLAARSAFCSKLVRQNARVDDIVLTFGTLFSPPLVDWPQAVVTFKDYTVELLLRSGWSHGVAHSELKERARFEAELCKSVAVVFTASENTRRSVIEDYGVHEHNVEAVGEGLCLYDPPRSVSTKRRNPNVLFVGKDFERKGGDVLLAAFGRVRSRVPSATLTIVGPPVGRRQPGVHWAGLVKDRTAIRSYYESASVFALPSRCEPFGLVFLEAMAFGLPCIATRRDAMPEIIEEGRTGFLVEPGDEVMLADRLVQLLQEGALAARMGEAGYERVMSRFRWSHVTERMDRRLMQVPHTQA